MNQKMDPKDTIIVALDVETVRQALRIVEELNDKVGCFKIGLQLLTHLAIKGWATDFDDKMRVAKLFDLLRGKLFVDGKFNDIPTTIGKAIKETRSISPKFVNVHASSGIEGIEAAVEAVKKGEDEQDWRKINILGVSVLTSITANECKTIFGDGPSEKVRQFAGMLIEARADGIICSPQELSILGGDEYKNLIKVVPGTRSIGVAVNDQKRVMTPYEAIKDGADYLVIGREITQPQGETSVEAAQRIAEEIALAM